MSQNSSNQSKSAKINVVLSNFQGLQYDINEDTEYEVIASHVNNILSNDRFQINHKSLPEIFIKISIDTADEHEISNLFLNPLLLTLTKHENEKSDTVGYCNVDLSILCSTKREAIECRKLFSSERMVRRVSFDVKASTNIPLMDTNYENCLHLTVESAYNLEYGKDDNILITLNAPNEVFRRNAYKVNELKIYQKSSKEELSSCYDSEKQPLMNFENELNQLCGQQHQCMNINANLKFIILSSEACLALHDHIRKYLKISMEILINSNEHLFGLIECAELLHVGRRKICVVVPLYKYDNEIFKGCSQCNSMFYKPELHLHAKSNRISRKTQNIQNRSVNSLEDIKALNSDGNQIAVVVQIELEKPLNEEAFNGMSKVSQKVQSFIHFNKNNLIKELSDKLFWDVEEFNGINALNIQNMMKGCGEMENSLISKMAVLRDHFQGSLDDDSFMCYLTSEIINAKKKSCNKVMLAEIYKSLGMIDKAEEIILHDIQNNQNSEAAWLNYAIFNAKQEEFDKMAVSVDELLKINPQSLVSNILKVYILFKSHKYAESLNLICNLTKTFGKIEELSSMQYVINAMLDIEDNLIKSDFKINDEIESIHNRTELIWFAARDDCLLSWQNLFIKSASFFIKIGCYDIAELCLGEYYQTYGININYLYLLAAIDSSKGNHKEALYHLNRISDCDIINYNLNYSKIVKSITLNLLHTNNFIKAAEIFNTYIQTESSDNFLIQFLLGSHFNRTNEFDIAKEFLIQAVKIFHCHVAFQELGKCFLGLNMLELAEKAFLSALQFETNNNDSMTNLREIYKIQGRYDAINFCDYNIQNNNNINNAH